MGRFKVLLLGQAGTTPMVLSALIGLVLAGLSVGQAWLLSRIFGSLYAHESAAILLPMVAAFTAILLARPVFGLLREVTVSETGRRIKRSVRSRLIRRINLIGPFALSAQRTGEVESLVTDGVEQLEDFYGRYIPQFVVTLVTVVVTISLMFVVDHLVGLVAAVAAILTPLLPRLWDRALAARGYNQWQHYARLNADVVDSMQGMTTLQLFDAVQTRRTSIVEATSELLAGTLRQMQISLLESALSSWMVSGGPVAILIAAAIRVTQGAFPIETLFWVVFLGFEIFRPFLDLSANWHHGYHGLTTARTAIDVLATPAQRGTNLSPDDPGELADIGIENVTYYYPGQQVPAIENVSLVISQGATYALVGESGCGKTTLIGLIQRLADPQQGAITIGGVDLRAIDEHRLRSIISLVPQEPILFSGTIADNLKAVAPHADREQMLELCSSLGLSDIAPLGSLLDTPVGERGNSVSGGQRQRIAIARAILRDTPILLLDEATSSLDGRTEKLVMKTLDEHRRTRESQGKTLTVVISAHRMSTIGSVDTVVVLDHGMVSEIGSPRQMLGRDGRYALLSAVDGEW